MKRKSWNVISQIMSRNQNIVAINVELIKFTIINKEIDV